jgi:hypothetical protein
VAAADVEGAVLEHVIQDPAAGLPAPDIVDAITGSTNQGMVPERLERPLPASWEEQIGRLSGVPAGQL